MGDRHDNTYFQFSGGRDNLNKKELVLTICDSCGRKGKFSVGLLNLNFVVDWFLLVKKIKMKVNKKKRETILLTSVKCVLLVWVDREIATVGARAGSERTSHGLIHTTSVGRIEVGRDR